MRKDLKLAGKEPANDIHFEPYKLKSHAFDLMQDREHRRVDSNGLIIMPFFEDSVLIIDFKDNRFGIIPPSHIKIAYSLFSF